MIFITGASGLIGSFLCRKFIEEGFAVKALKRATSDLSLLKGVADKVEWVTGDVCDINCLHEAISPDDVVIHCAAIVDFSPKHQERLFRVNVEGTANVVNVCLEKKVKKLIHLSSVAAIGRGKTETNLNENTRWEDSKQNTLYAQSKYLSELEVWRGIEEGLDAFVLNPSVVLGPGDENKSSTQLFRQLQKNPKFYADGGMNYVDVRDLTDITFRLFQEDENHERYIINADNISVKKFYQTASPIFNTPAPKYRVTYRMARMGLVLLWLRWFFTGKKSFLNKEILKTLKSSHYFENQKICQRLNYQFKSLEDSIAWVHSELVVDN